MNPACLYAFVIVSFYLSMVKEISGSALSKSQYMVLFKPKPAIREPWSKEIYEGMLD